MLDTTDANSQASRYDRYTIWAIAATLVLAASLILWRDHALRTFSPATAWAIYWNDPAGPSLAFTIDNGPVTEFEWRLSSEGQTVASGRARVAADTKTVIAPDIGNTPLAKKILLQVTGASETKRELYKIFP